jgi:hypothetical protein
MEASIHLNATHWDHEPQQIEDEYENEDEIKGI